MDNQVDNVNRERRILKNINIQHKVNDFMINYEKKRFLNYYYAFIGITFFSFYLKYKSNNGYYVIMKYIYGFLFTCSPMLYMYMIHHLFNKKLLDRVQLCEQQKSEDNNTNHHYNNDDYTMVIRSYYDSVKIS